MKKFKFLLRYWMLRVIPLCLSLHLDVVALVKAVQDLVTMSPSALLGVRGSLNMELIKL